MQPPTIYKPGKLGYLWNYLGSSLKSFAAALSPYMGGGDVGYKKYVALLYPGANPGDNPIPTVLENTLGSDVVWRYGQAGTYAGSNSNFVDANKVFVTINGNWSNEGNGNVFTANSEVYDSGSGNEVWFYTTNYSLNAVDNWAAPIFIEIRIYP